MKQRTAHAPNPDPAIATAALARVESADEREYARLMLVIEANRRKIADLEGGIAPLEKALATFEWEYQAKLGGLLAELRDVQGITQRIEHRTARVHARLVCDPGGILGDLFDREELLDIGTLFGITIPESWFADDPEPREQRTSGEPFDEQASAEDEILRRLRRRPTSPNADPDLRVTYRDLARRFHPDLAVDDADRIERQDMMLRINAAWQAGDLGALRKIQQDTEHLAPDWQDALIARRLAWAAREDARLRDRITALESRMKLLRESDTFPLWFDAKLGASVISRQANALRGEIVIAKERLERAKDAFRMALHQFATATSIA
jgi:predicted  nucleic acid-binding Zn-ribbon protein